MTPRHDLRALLACAGLASMLLGAPAQAQPAPAPTPAPPPAPEALISADLITVADATTLAQAALAACRAIGLPTTVRVVDAKGNARVIMTDDGASALGMQSSGQKLAAVQDFKVSTGDLAARAQNDPQFAAQYGKDTRYRFSPGAFPLYRGDAMVGILAVGGSRNRDADCANAAIKSLPWAAFTPKAAPAR